MALTLNGSNNTIAGLAVGGLPDGIVDTDMIAASAVTAAKASGSAKGITVKDQWRITSTFTGNAEPISANLERCDTSAGLIGSAMTESSGVFTFPETGKWLIEFSTMYYINDAESRYIESFIYKTQNNGTSWVEAGRNGGSVWDSNSNTYSGNHISFLFDVTDVSTHKVKFDQTCHNANVITMGDTDHNWTHFTFTRYGDT